MRFGSADLQTMGGWIGRIFRMDFSAFDEIRSEVSATTSAVFIVLASSVLAGVGSWAWAAQHDFVNDADVLVRSLILGGMIQTVVWFLWVYLVFQVMARGYGARLDIAELIRTMGFAFSPMALSILIAITSLAVPIGLISFGLTLLFTNAAIQHTSGGDAGEATMANITGFASFVIVMGVFANVLEVNGFGGTAPGLLFFALDL